jgi:cytochrome c oxidase subunit 3
MQYFEYTYSEFTIADSVFGSVFYKTTGLHAIHVILGVLFLLFCGTRLLSDFYTIEHAVSFEFAILYYHLVDVVWLFVFLTYYFWSA